MISLNLPKWYDLHVHVRQDAPMKDYIKAQIDMGCAGILAMPNTKPPVGKVFEKDNLPYWSIEYYKRTIKSHANGAFDQVIVPLYLTKDTSADMIEEGAKSGLLKACKYYPPHGTTNSDHGRPLQNFMDNGVFKAMEECGVTLCIHGEEHGLNGSDYFDNSGNAETKFYHDKMPRLYEAHPSLKIVAEHITTAAAVNFVKQTGKNVTATVTPQHLLYTVGHLVQGFRYHLFCLPLVKFDGDRQALREAVTAIDNDKFFAGTDSAPHTTKATPCGCAAGCFTGQIAPQLYAEGFEAAGCDLNKEDAEKAFEKFLCLNGPAFYGFPPSKERFTLTREKSLSKPLQTESGVVVPLPVGLDRPELDWSLVLE